MKKKTNTKPRDTMFTIGYTTFSGIKKSISVIDEEYAYAIFETLIKAIDAQTVDMMDGFTGEVIMRWREGKYTVIGGRGV